MWLDLNRTLVVHRNHDTWQMPVSDRNGAYLGNVIAQIVEPDACMVRYFLLYNSVSDRQILLPSDSVESIDQVIHCSIDASSVAKIPDYDQSLERSAEIMIHQLLAHTPYWEDQL